MVAGGMRVYVDPLVSLTRTAPDGTEERVLFIRFEDRILVHPDRWDEFWLAVNQPDVYGHPEVRALFQDPEPPPSEVGQESGEKVGSAEGGDV